MSGLSFVDRARVEWAVRRVDMKLDGRVPWRRRREIRNELRGNLVEAALSVGAKAAVRQLGDLHKLASSYLELYRGRFDFQTGTWLAVIVYAALSLMALAVWIAFTSGVIAGGGHDAAYSFGPFGGNVSGHSFEFVFFSPAHAAALLLAFVIGSSYRLILHRR